MKFWQIYNAAAVFLVVATTPIAARGERAWIGTGVPLCPYAANKAECLAALAKVASPPSAQHPDFYNSGVGAGYASQSGAASNFATQYTGSISGTTLYIPTAPDLSACVSMQCTIAGTGVTLGTYITGNIDPTHWTVSVSQNVASETLATVRRPAENLCGVEYYCGSYTDFLGIIAGGDSSAIDAIDPAVSHPASCSWLSTGFLGSAAPYLSCTTGIASRTISHLYFGPIAGRHGAAGLLVTHSSLIAEDLRWDADATLVTIGGSGHAFLYYDASSGTQSANVSYISMYGYGSINECCSIPSTQAFAFIFRANPSTMTWSHVYTRNTSGRIIGITNTTGDTNTETNNFYDGYGFTAANGHLEYNSLGIWGNFVSTDNVFFQPPGTVNHQAAFRASNVTGTVGTLDFERNTIAWNLIANASGNSYSATFCFAKSTDLGNVNCNVAATGHAPGSPLGGIIMLTADIAATTCGGDNLSQCTLAPSSAITSTDAYFHQGALIYGDGYHAGSLIYYDCGAATATTACPLASGSNPYYYGNPSSSIAAASYSIAPGVVQYTGMDGGAAAFGTSPSTIAVNCNGTNTTLCLFGNFVSPMGATSVPVWNALSCSTASVVANNFNLTNGASLNTKPTGTGC